MTPNNDPFLKLMAEEVELVVAAWGGRSEVRADRYERRVTEVVDLLGADRFTSFGVTAAGHPRSGYSWRFGRHQLADWNLSLVRSW